MRKRLLAGNWKMHKTNAELDDYFQTFVMEAGYQTREVAESVDVVFAVPYTLIEKAVALTARHHIAIAAQNVHQKNAGAFTGEVSIPMLKESRAAAVLVGHSERRQHYGETDAAVAEKTRALLDAGMAPIVCVGETLDEREADQTNAVLRKQMNAVLSVLDAPGDMIVAYEPVWAIGTGLTATPEQAQDAHAQIRGLVGARLGEQAASKIRILYGGSAKPDNIGELLAQPDIDGGLVGGASLDPVGFAAMVRTSARFD